MDGTTVKSGKETRYYTALGRATDYILRCKDCRALVLVADLHQLGSCTCGNRRYSEITLLSDEDMARIRLMDFPYRDEFLAEFSPVPSPVAPEAGTVQ